MCVYRVIGCRDIGPDKNRLYRTSVKMQTSATMRTASASIGASNGIWDLTNPKEMP